MRSFRVRVGRSVNNGGPAKANTVPSAREVTSAAWRFSRNWWVWWVMLPTRASPVVNVTCRFGHMSRIELKRADTG